MLGYLLLFLVLISKTINHLKKINMKNAFKVGFLALAIAVSFTACKGSASTATADSAKMADSAKAADSVKADSSKMKMADTTKADSTKKDTTKK
jgi:hypothetical protein